MFLLTLWGISRIVKWGGIALVLAGGLGALYVVGGILLSLGLSFPIMFLQETLIPWIMDLFY